MDDVDLYCFDDIDYKLAKNKDNLLGAIYRRLTTPMGGLIYDLEYGFDLHELIGVDIDNKELNYIKYKIVNQCQMDERVDFVDCDISFLKNNLIIKLMIVAVDASIYNLTLKIDQISVEIL